MNKYRLNKLVPVIRSNKSLSDLSDNKFVYLIVGGLALIYFFTKGTVGAVKDIFTPTSDLDKANIKSTFGATINQNQAQSIANNFYVGLATANGGFYNDWNLILAQFAKLKNDFDYNLVFNAFGKRQYSTFWKNGGDPLFSNNWDLNFILSNDLSLEEKNIIINKFPNLHIF